MTISGITSFGATGLWVRYGDIVALAEVTLAVPGGQVTAVVGGDGAGKTTLLRCLAGAQQPDAGEVRRPNTHRVGYLPPRTSPSAQPRIACRQPPPLRERTS